MTLSRFFLKTKQPFILKTKQLIRLHGAMFSTTESYKLPDLPYDYNALEPVLPAKIMELHHQKHHGTYVTNLNTSLEKRDAALAKRNLDEVIKLDGLIKFNGGGHINHSIFWTNLSPIKQDGGKIIKDNKIIKAINEKWGNIDKFIETFNNSCTGIQGSGWGWLAWCPANKQLVIKTMPNQDPVGSLGVIPLLGIDMWEHAFYLKYENRKAEYLKEIWKIVNWKNVEERYNNATSK